jgi:hypothetical protein
MWKNHRFVREVNPPNQAFRDDAYLFRHIGGDFDVAKALIEEHIKTYGL